MEQQYKSVLDDVPVDNSAFTGSPDYRNKGLLEVVGQCPNCGSPIYGHKELIQGQFPVVQHSCRCLYKSKTIQETMQTK